MKVERDNRVGIIGGGFAGPVAALALHNKGFKNITLFEESEHMHSKGFGIGLTGNGKFLLNQLGVTLSDMSSALLLKKMETCGSKGNLMKTLYLPDLTERQSYTLAREDLHQALIARLSDTSVSIKTGKRVSRVSHEHGSEIITLSDGATEAFDVLIGAGGINSVARSTLYCHASQKFSDWATWWFWGGGEIDFNCPRSYVAPNITFGVFPLADGRHFFTGYTHGTPDSVLRADVETQRSYLQTMFANFSNADQVVHSAVAADTYMARRTSMIKVRQSYCKNIILIGDAEHAFSPLLGLGTSLAIEDAMVLARCLSDAADTENDLVNAFSAYDTERTPRIRTVQIMSGVMWTCINITKNWQQVVQKISSALTPKWLLSLMYKKVVIREVNF